MPSLPTSSNGQAPKFPDVFSAVNQVLTSAHSDDALTLDELANPLTFVQCTQIAAGYCSSNPLPTIDSAAKAAVGDLYTLRSPKERLSETQYRSEFESQLSSYPSSFRSSLTTFIFAASNAVCCELRMRTASSAGLTFLVVTNPSSSAASVVAAVV